MTHDNAAVGKKCVCTSKIPPHDASTLQIVQEGLHNVNLVNVHYVQEKCSQVEAVSCGQG